MEEVVNWLNSNINLVIIVGSGLLEFILLLVLKITGKTEIISNDLYFRAVLYASEAEKKYGTGHGAEKLEYVISKFGDGFPRALIAQVVSQVLSCQKKVK